MIGWLPVGAALTLGWAIRRLARRADGGCGAFPEIVALGIVATVAWMIVLDLAGVPWSALSLLAPVAVAGALGLRPGSARRAARPGRWQTSWIAAAAALPHAVAIAAVPSFGWDFRYIWGLKARLFAAARTHDLATLAWPASVHPDYPPLWSDLLAFGRVLGAPVELTAATWQATLCVALAVACWHVAGTSRLPIRLLAAAVGGWAPVIFRPDYSGYAEALLAFFAVVALASLGACRENRRQRGLRWRRLARRPSETPAGVAAAYVEDVSRRPTKPGGCQREPQPEHFSDRLLAHSVQQSTADVAMLGVAAAGLALTKNEGIALGLGVALGASRALGFRRALPVIFAYALAAGGWRLALLSHGISGGDFSLSGPLALQHVAELPAAMVAALTPVTGVLIAAWLVALLGLIGRSQTGVRVALVLWGLAVCAAYLTTTFDLSWHLATSLDRVLATPLPAAIALALAATTSSATDTRHS